MATQSDPTRLEAAANWREALIEDGWFETCATEEVAVTEAMGRVTAESVIAVRSVPHYAGSAMDGFAIRAADTRAAAQDAPITLSLQSGNETVLAGTAVAVNTGDALPPEADSVIMKEHVGWQDGKIVIFSAVLPGQHVRQIGEDIAVGALVLPAGRIISPADIASALAAGGDRIPVKAKPRVTVIPTGDEIVDSAEKLKPGYIRDINSPMLSALITGWGAVVMRHPIVHDVPEALREAILSSLEVSDLVVTNAGTSNGTEDFTGPVLGILGELCCQGVAIRPGRPVLLAVVGGKPVIGLPGYPVSCMLTAQLFLRELIYEFQGARPPEKRIVRARLTQEIHSKPGVEEFLRVTMNQGRPYAEATVLPRGASLISALSQADGMLRIEADCAIVGAGEIVEIEMF